MNTRHDEAPKTPLVLDTRGDAIREAIETLIDIEKAERLQVVAGEIGGFSVSVIANEGDPYQAIYEADDGRAHTTSPIRVPEGKVIVSMQNTSPAENPTYLSPLWQAADVL